MKSPRCSTSTKEMVDMDAGHFVLFLYQRTLEVYASFLLFDVEELSWPYLVTLTDF